MLVMKRKMGETVRVGNDVEVIVNWIRGNTVSLAFDAPAEIKLLRGELVDSAIAREQAECKEGGSGQRSE